jgi:hypothetical protein
MILSFAALADAVYSGIWFPVLDNVRSISYCNPRVKLERLPWLFQAASKCTHMSMIVAAIGTAEQRVTLEGGITMVSELYLKARNVYVDIPSGVKWSHICCYECGKLDIRCAATASFVLNTSFPQPQSIWWSLSGCLHAGWSTA